MGFPGVSAVKNLLVMQVMWVQSLGLEDPLEKEMATHSNILAWEISCTEEPDKLQSMGLQSWTQLSDQQFPCIYTEAGKMVNLFTEQE